ncbi:MAG: C1 family peptidase [Pseudomonadota bacterium]
MRTLLLLVLVTLPCTSAHARYDLERVQRAIVEQGKHWQARDTALTRMSDEERARRTMPSYPFPQGFALPEGGWHEPEPHRGATWASVTDATFSWDDLGGACYLTPVRDQGDCGSCFVFGSLAATEAQYRIVRQQPGYAIDLAEQELISCISIDDCASGGTAEQVGAYLKSTGVPAESCFPYTSGSTGNDGQCADSCANGSEQRYFIHDWEMSTLPWTSDELKARLLVSPIIANLQIYSDFLSYAGGVYSRTTNQTRGWHIVALVGWDDGDNSWIIKNSWGEDWGMQGYGKIDRGERDCVPTMPLGYFDGTCFASHSTVFEITTAETGSAGSDAGAQGSDAGVVTTDAATAGTDRSSGVQDSGSVGQDAGARPDTGAARDAQLADHPAVDSGASASDRSVPDSLVVGADSSVGTVGQDGCACAAARADHRGALTWCALLAGCCAGRRRRARTHG